MHTMLDKSKTRAESSAATQSAPETLEDITLARRRPSRILATGRWLAFSIEDDAIEMSAAIRRGKFLKLLDARKIYLRREDNSLEDRDDRICSLIDEFIRNYGGFQPRLCLVLNGPETVLRTFDMPVLKGAKLDSAIRYEARKRLPFPVNDCHLDYRVTATYSSRAGDRLRITLLAATRRLVQKNLDYFISINRTPDHVYIGYDAISQVVGRFPNYDEDGISALVNVDHGTIHLAYYRGDCLEFFHVTTLGNVDGGYRTRSGGNDSFTEQIARDIQTSLDYYAGLYSRAEMSRLHLYGDLTYADELVEQLEDEYGFSFDRFPTQNLKALSLAHEDLAPSLSVCLPTVAACACNEKLANLLPFELREKKARRQAAHWSAAVIFCLAAGLAMFSWGYFHRVHQLEVYASSLSLEIAGFRASDVFDKYNAIKHQISQNRNYISKVARKPSYLGPSLKELSRLAPPGMRLQILNFDNTTPGNAVTMVGTISSRDIPPELVLAEFVESLRLSPFYDSVTVERHVKRAVGDTFELEFHLGMRGVV